MISKKAQVEVQFNWIFILIAGAVLLGFFFLMISSQSNTNETKISATLTRTFKTIVDATAQKSGTLKEYSFASNLNIEFQCKENSGLYNYKLNDVKVADIKYDVIFAPESMIGRNIYTWTREWELPDEQGFSVTTFLYMTNKLQGFIFVNDSSNGFKTIYNNFPKNISQHTTTINDNHELTNTFSELNYNKYKFIVFNDSYFYSSDGTTKKSISLPNNLVNRFSAIIISPDNDQDVFKKGKVCYCNSQSTCNAPIDCVNYLGSASLYGAIFSDNGDYYKCTMNKAFDKLYLTSALQYHRLTSVELAGGLSSSCKLYLGLLDELDSNTPKDWLQQLTGLEVEAQGLLNNTFSDLTDVDVEIISNLLDKIYNQNRVLALEQNCIQIY